MLQRFFRRQPAPDPAPLYSAIVAQARHPVFYERLGVPDTLDGRFDLLVLHLTAVLDRLRNADRSTSPFGQLLFDWFITDMDRSLREMGVGDLSVPKKMKTIGQSFYGRYQAYTHAGDRDDLAGAIRRNLFTGDGPQDVCRALADYFGALQDVLGELSDADIEAARIPWPSAPTGPADAGTVPAASRLQGDRT